MKTKLLKDPNDMLTIRKTIKSAQALQYIKAELAGQLTPQMKKGVSRSDVPVIRSKSKEEASPLLSEILHYADQGHLPIIVVPSASSSKSRLNILNADKFLRLGIFEEPNPRTMSRPASIPIIVEHAIGGRMVRFRVYDDTSKFRKFEWKSCVAVFAEGKKWQFSGWPFKTEADLFYSFRGFNLKYLDEPVDTSIAQLNIANLNLRREGRHQDASVAAEFWRALETFLLAPRIRKFSNDHKL